MSSCLNLLFNHGPDFEQKIKTLQDVTTDVKVVSYLDWSIGLGVLGSGKCLYLCKTIFINVHVLMFLKTSV